MGRQSYTNGDVVITFDECECRSIAGCEKCKPITLYKETLKE